MISQLKKQYETKSMYLIGFFLAYPLVILALGAPKALIESRFMYGLVIWTLIYISKPIRKWLVLAFAILQGLWTFSLVQFLPTNMKINMNILLDIADFIYDKLYGGVYLNFIKDMTDYLMIKSMVLDPIYIKLLNIIVITMIMLLVTDFIEKRVNWKVFLGVGLAFILSWFLYVDNVKSAFSIYFIGLTMYRQYVIYEKQVKNAIESGERTRYYNYSSAIMVGAVVMTSILIISNIVYFYLPMDRLNEAVNKVIPRNDVLRSDYKVYKSSRIFNFKSTMYSPNDYLGGPLGERDFTVIMRVKSDVGPLYLRGRVKNIYDGSKWSSAYTTFTNKPDISLVRIPESELREITLYPDTLSSRTIFSPYLYYDSSFKYNKIYENQDAVVYRKSSKANNLERYTVQYVDPEFAYKYERLEDVDFKDYLDLPASGLDKTRQLTQDLVGGLKNDEEKMNALVEYLSNSYRYSLLPEAVDVDKDFVEEFLFDTQKGYCTYFATSLAVMGRISNVPTRYVEGFITSMNPSANGLYDVSGNTAHAWVEAYIQGRGWTVFEATPAYIPREEAETPGEDRDSVFVGDEVPDDLPDFVIEPEEGGNTFEQVDRQDYTWLVYTVFVLLLGAFVVMKYRRLKYDLDHGDYKGKVLNRIAYLMSMTMLVDEAYDPSQVPSEVLKRVAGQMLEFEIDDHIVNLMNKALYSQHKIGAEDFEAFDVFFRDYEKQIKTHLSALSYFMSKYVFNSFYHSSYY